MGIGKRLTYYVEKQGFTKKSFCERYSFEYNNLTSIMSEKRVLGIKTLDQLHIALPTMNVHWLLYGEGPEDIDEKQINILNEPGENYISKNDAFEFMLLKYLENEKIKKKIYEIIEQKARGKQ